MISLLMVTMTMTMTQCQDDRDTIDVRPVECCLSVCHWFLDIIYIYRSQIRLACWAISAASAVLFVYSMMYMLTSMGSDPFPGRYIEELDFQQRAKSEQISEGLHDAFSNRIKLSSKFKRAM